MSADAMLAGLFDPNARDDPYPRYAALRALGPVAPLTRGAPGATTFAAVVTGYDEVDRVLRDPGFYKKGRPDWREHSILTTFETSMMFNNPPDHGRMRRVFQGVFTPRRLAALQAPVEQVVDRLLDRIAALGAGGAPWDYVAEFALPLPTLVMAAFLGIPESDLAWFQQRITAIDAYLDLDGKTPQRLRAADDSADELRAYYAGLVAERRRGPRADLVSDLVAAIDAGDRPIDEFELISNLIVLFNASYITTVYLLSSGLPLVLSRSDLVRALPGAPDLAVDCADEVLRCESPVQFLTRAASSDTEVGGVPVAADEVVLLLIGAANRDPRRFPDPDEFRPGRPGPASLAFGAGAHFCLGAAVSRLEARFAWPRLFARFPDLALAGPPVRTGSLFLRGIDALPVTYGRQIPPG